jgi:hypothetical protein
MGAAVMGGRYEWMAPHKKTLPWRFLMSLESGLYINGYVLVENPDKFSRLLFKL